MKRSIKRTDFSDGIASWGVVVLELGSQIASLRMWHLPWYLKDYTQSCNEYPRTFISGHLSEYSLRIILEVQMLGQITRSFRLQSTGHKIPTLRAPSEQPLDPASLSFNRANAWLGKRPSSFLTSVTQFLHLKSGDITSAWLRGGWGLKMV